ncbi:MAG: ATP-binding protein [Burkholderiaceae bacterium]
MPRPPFTLAQRLTATVLLMVLAIWLGTAALAWQAAQRELNELLDAHLAQTAALLLAVEDERDEAPAVLRAPILLHKYQSRVAFQIWRAGVLRAHSADAPAVPLGAASAPGLASRRIDGTLWRVFTVVQPLAGGASEVIHVGEHVSARRQVLLASLRGMWVPLLLALPLLAAGIVWVVRRALRPLRALGARVAARSPLALHALPEDAALPEVRPLVQALNGLFARMREQLASEQRLTQDAAHELRTPIAAIRMQAQVAQGASDADERDAALAAVVAGCDRATHLVEQLLQLARLESDAAWDRPDTDSASRPAHADLTAVAAELVAGFGAAAGARQQHIEGPGPGPGVPVPMASALATVLLRNLLDNALRYSPQGATVRVRVTPGTPGTPGTGVCLSVEDSGPGLDAAAGARLGERFFRALGSGQSGSGLGWSIVRRLQRLHGLRVDVDRSPELGGLRVRVRWPPS